MSQPNHLPLAVVGAGIAGSEAAWQLAQAGYRVDLYEMRPHRLSEAHQTGLAAELICSNSFKSLDLHNAHGALKAELLAGGSRVLQAALENRIPAGSALAVDRNGFSQSLTQALEGHPMIQLVRQEVADLEVLLAKHPHLILATGPLTSQPLMDSLGARLGQEGLYFYDAIAPVVFEESIDYTQAFRAARYDKGGADYLNCPFTKEQYADFVTALVGAEKVGFKDFEQPKHFEGCLPIEVMAGRTFETLAFGPLKPVGLTDPKTGRQPYAVLQLRQENRSGTLYNMVGCQTRMTWPEQQKVFRKVPGLGQAEFARLGSMHRNSYLNAPKHLGPGLTLKVDPRIQVAGQLTGAEGYSEAVGTGYWAALCLKAQLEQKPLPKPDPKTLLGSLIFYLSQASADNFQPMNANWGLVDSPKRPRSLGKSEFRTRLAEAGLKRFLEILAPLR
ncbi:MAG: methylenetetrahydrofolate--tRNA-(uracil(54)-C(5))-methyltransferase (FADH(2)-oxidizing) TrmFO [Candidatus Lambdaproteobacteria bacterium RIFOXYD1_FULL_56_27]|uniref:Methylenetetrahydrofolate--tRNA-(uracil-5-)-methyltransferase TrmFO n=1 Tax=Candidatus Lambdaproteobacteria bacterium RIFOXYD2_FULL_56_26 TaxID=1817773 RepID=A0A1F6GM80_9PROT|nr:MAG: methylenetetrahydrofolate--tRNA-(uracil(54)-C(5))-methyltransferase (FADH(2)-oxidizing) TrmFO [Candidatus Lambdaproteobacteria bacterium RIFOXYD2_FULL_56_26]OGH01748.1 MAG: methylenetetrahydrofolate--tRNA-(uracil(54)-C(5))-methyltransferase (FADH(2)-oxidizing) TrmFO [Candidatus Lambdaproteobacteria bacterium RIFOXYC1_FULL_56_13]OGH07621.1 MAG: methylenetetrahydrofolate--tRNA-(uracil(54)-C(5))-methyltransferase (FADH(2)-oxidizing) TrmFO [Candidatus Lambdaproteobacteria bacterium RIFOXYD1_F